MTELEKDQVAAGASTGAAGARVADAGIAIVGFGVAGFNAAAALRLSGYRGVIRVFSDAGARPYSPIITSYYASGEKTRDDCFPWSEEDIADLGLELVMEPVISLDPQAHLVRTQTGAYPYAKCVIATGASPVGCSFSMSGEYEPLVLRTMDDADRLHAALSSEGCKRVLVSGASMVALKIVEACLVRGVQPTLVGMNEHVLDMSALPQAAERFERNLAAKGVELRLSQTVQSVNVVADPAHPLGRALEVTFSTGDMASFDELCVAHGARGNLSFLADGSLRVDRGLPVDDFMRTSDPDVYAAGDVARATELISGEKQVVGIWKNAAVQGACAGKAIAAELAGEPLDASFAFKGALSANTIAVCDALFISAGTAEVMPNRRVETRETDDMAVVCLYEQAAEDGERLVGFNIACDHDEAGGLAYDTGAMLTLRIEEGLRG